METPSFKPHPLLRGGQLQTIAGQFLARPKAEIKPSPRHPSESLHVPLPDGDHLLLRVDWPRHDDAQRPMVLLMHGLGGDSEVPYLLRLVIKLTRQGHPVLRFNHRGCGPGAATLARGIYHAGRAEDLAATLAFIEAKWPERALGVAAFSLSGNLLLRYLGEAGADRPHPQLRRALAVCPPVDLEQCSLALTTLKNWPIDRYYTQRLVTAVNERRSLFPDINMPELPRRLNLRLFDEVYTAPLAGFASRLDYYDQSSAKHYAHRIKTPTVILAAADDPIIPSANFAQTKFSAAVSVRLEASGGHMGFVEGKTNRLGDRRWMDLAVVDWASTI